MNISSCKSCLAPVQWVIMEKTGKHMPINIDKKTIVVIDEKGCYMASGYESHFATCPNAGKHRSKPSG